MCTVEGYNMEDKVIMHLIRTFQLAANFTGALKGKAFWISITYYP